MKCPFRTDEKGEFMECYEKDCMAFCITKSPEKWKAPEGGHYRIDVKNCKLMNPTPFVAPHPGCV